VIPSVSSDENSCGPSKRSSSCIRASSRRPLPPRVWFTILTGVATRELSVSDLAFHALRDYQPGDERRYIHWKSSAKTGRYMVRQFEQSRRSHLVVAMSLAPEDYRDDDEFELAVSVTGSLGVRAIRDARSVSVVTGQHGAPSTPSRQLHGIRSLAAHRSDRLLDELARIDRVDQAPGLRQLARSVADQLSQVSLAFPGVWRDRARPPVEGRREFISL